MTYKIAEKKRLAQRARASRQRASLPEIVLLLIMLVVNSTPILWGLVTSLKTRREILVYPPKFFNFTPSLEHYFNVFRNGLDIGMRNSLLYSACTIALGLVLGLLAAYGFERYHFPFKKILFYIVIAGIPLSIGSAAMLIPNYLYMMELGLTNKWYTLILLYTAYNLPMAIWIMKGGIEAIPLEIEDAALIDGCSRAYIIGRLIPRLILPSIASSALFLFIGAWNEFITAAVMIDSPELRSIQLVIYYFRGFFGTDWGALMASAMIAVLPILVVFSFLGKLMVSGLTQGAVKNFRHTAAGGQKQFQHCIVPYVCATGNPQFLNLPAGKGFTYLCHILNWVYGSHGILPNVAPVVQERKEGTGYAPLMVLGAGTYLSHLLIVVQAFHHILPRNLLHWLPHIHQ